MLTAQPVLAAGQLDGALAFRKLSVTRGRRLALRFRPESRSRVSQGRGHGAAPSGPGWLEGEETPIGTLEPPPQGLRQEPPSVPSAARPQALTKLTSVHSCCFVEAGASVLVEGGHGFLLHPLFSHSSVQFLGGGLIPNCMQKGTLSQLHRSPSLGQALLLPAKATPNTATPTPYPGPA